MENWAIARQSIVENHRGQLAADIASLRTRLDQLRDTQTVKVDQLIGEANELINLITDLNPKISKFEASGLLRNDAGSLRTQRYNALSRLSEIIPIRFRENKEGTIDVFSGSDYLILTGETQQLESYPVGDRNVTVNYVRLTNTKSLLSQTSGGELSGIIDGRDAVLGGFIDELDVLASNLIFEFNRIHSSGEGLAGFSSLTADNKVDDSNAVLNATNLSFTPTHGSFELRITSTSGATETTKISIDLDGIGADSSLESLRASLDAVANVSASITPSGQLQINADPDFEFRFANDTSGVLTVLGINTFFRGSDSNDIGINSVVASDHQFFASSQGG